MPLRYTYFVHFDQCDPAGILFFGESFSLAHRSIEKFIETSGIGWDNWFNNELTAFPIRNASCDYFQPVSGGTEIDISIEITDLSKSTVCFGAVAEQSGYKKFRVQSVHTAIDKMSRTKADIPPEIFLKLSQFQQSK